MAKAAVKTKTASEVVVPPVITFDEGASEAAKAAVEALAIDPRKMFDAGLHFGHRKSREHPAMKPFLFGVRNNISIFDLEKSHEYLNRALMYIYDLVHEGKTILFVASDIPARKLVTEHVSLLGMPYVVSRWLGGTLTNFKTLKSRIDQFRELKEKKASGELEKYTKKEQLDFTRDLIKLTAKFEGLLTLEKFPDALFLFNAARSPLPAREAQHMDIPVIAICDSDTDPHLVDYVIPANDDAVSSVGYILEKIIEVIKQAKDAAIDTK